MRSWYSHAGRSGRRLAPFKPRSYQTSNHLVPWINRQRTLLSPEPTQLSTTHRRLSFHLHPHHVFNDPPSLICAPLIDMAGLGSSLHLSPSPRRTQTTEQRGEEWEVFSSSALGPTGHLSLLPAKQLKGPSNYIDSKSKSTTPSLSPSRCAPQ